MAIGFSSRRVNVMLIITGALEIIVAMYAGEKVMSVIATMLNGSGSLFYSVFTLFGLGGNGTHLNGTVSGTGSLMVVAVLIGGIITLMGFLGLRFGGK